MQIDKVSGWLWAVLYLVYSGLRHESVWTFVKTKTFYWYMYILCYTKFGNILKFTSIMMRPDYRKYIDKVWNTFGYIHIGIYREARDQESM